MSAARVSKGLDEPIRLEKVLGVTSLSNAALALCPVTGFVAYAAGSLVVIYDPVSSKQVKFFQASRAVTCIAFSADGSSIACGEKGYSPLVTVWSMQTGSLTAQLAEHTNGVGAIAFSPDGQFLVSVGFKHDKQLIVWSLIDKTPLSKKKLSNKVNSISFSSDGSYFVTFGDRHLKWWYIDAQESGIEVVGKPASILEVLKDANFTDGVCGIKTLSKYVYCATSSGALCVFHSNRIMDRWVQIDSARSYSLSMYYDSSNDSATLALGCSNGRVFLIDPQTLMCSASLPAPVPLPVAPADVNQSRDAGLPVFPACFATKVIPPIHVSGKIESEPVRIFNIYADRSIFVWERTNASTYLKKRSFVYHRGCVWDVVFLPASSNFMPSGTFLTCSADNSIRFWNTNREGQRESHWKSAYSKDLLHTIHLDVPTSGIPAETSSAVRSAGESIIYNQASQDTPTFDMLSSAIPDTEIPDRPDGSRAPRVLAAHPTGSCIAVGDRAGRIRTFDLSNMMLSQSINAHDAEVLTLQYSPAPPSTTDLGSVPTILLASAGRDRLVHIFEAGTDGSDDGAGHCTPVNTLDNHSSSVTAMTFTSDGKRLLTCGGDKTMVFNAVDGTEITRIKSVQTSNGTINGLSVDATNKFAVTSGQDKKVNIWNVITGKHVRAYYQDSWGELYKCDIDPSGMFIATCGFDKMIRILDFFSGEVVTEFYGHSELITAIKFSPDGKSLISISGDGCIIQWRLGGSLRSAMKERLVELYSEAKRKQEKLVPQKQTEGDKNIIEPASSALDNLRSSADSASENPVTSNVATTAKNRWKARVKNEGGYELFGKKISISASCDGFIPSSLVNEHRQYGGKQLNKFTIDFSQTERSNSTANDILRTASRTAVVEALDTVQLGDVNEDLDVIISEENVNGVEKSDSEPVAVNDSDIYADDFEAEDEHAKVRGSDGDIDPQLVRASIHLDNLERNASALESWLEDKLRNESCLDSIALTSSLATFAPNNVLNPPTLSTVPAKCEPTVADRLEIHLEKSLTSNFFRALIPASEGNILDAKDGSNAIPPPPEIEIEPFVAGKNEFDMQDEQERPKLQSSSSNDEQIFDSDEHETVECSPRRTKQRQTAVVVSLMKERLTAMGIVDNSDEIERPIVEHIATNSASLSPKQKWRQELRKRIAAKKDKSDDHLSDTQTESEDERDGDDEESNNLFPPPPPSASYDGLGDKTKSELIDNFSFPSDNTLLAALNDNSDQDLPEIRLVESFADNGNFVAIRDKTTECRKIMSELTSLTEKAMKAFSDLNHLRTSVSLPLPVSEPSIDVGENDVGHLFSDFRTSISSLVSFASMIEKDRIMTSSLAESSVAAETRNGHSVGQSLLTGKDISESSVMDRGATEVSDITLAFFENYSDRLAEMVSAKVMKKLEASNSILSQSLNLTSSTTTPRASSGDI